MQVLEVWMVWAAINAVNNPPFMHAAMAFIQRLSGALKAPRPRAASNEAGATTFQRYSDSPRQLILAVPPLVPSSPGRPHVASEHVAALSPYVDFW
jgi:hypothetical protein